MLGLGCRLEEMCLIVVTDRARVEPEMVKETLLNTGAAGRTARSAVR